VEGGKVCPHESSVRTIACSSNRDHTILYSHDPAVVGALPFKYTESIVPAATALH
jgi:hypothetical protein